MERYKLNSNLIGQSVQGNAHLQYVFDNAEYNLHTLDGHGTFHAMNGIVCVTPKKCSSCR